MALPLYLRYRPHGLYTPMQTEGEIAGSGAAGAAASLTLSTLGTTSIEDVRRVNPNGRLWFQLYMMRQRRFPTACVERAAKAGYDTPSSP